jgi:hypothetical protein
MKRVWAIDERDRNTAPELRTVIQGQAFVQYGDVRAIGDDKPFKEFQINLLSSDNVRADYDWCKAHESRRDASYTWERQRQKLQDEVLAVSPPTAVLSVGKWEGADWTYIECKLDPSLLQQLADEMLAGRLEQLTIGIEWVDGLTDRWIPYTLWLYKPAPDKSHSDPGPDPVHGHVTHVSWKPVTNHSHAHAGADDAGAAKLDEHLRKWLINAETEQLKDENGHRVRCANAAIDAVKAVAAWFKQHDDPNDPDRIAYRLEYHLEESVRFVKDLDQALHPKKSEFADDTSKLWFHRDFKRFYSFAKKPSQRANAIDGISLAGSVGEYLDHPEFHTPYLDWVLIDALTFVQCVSTVEAFAEQKIGWTYELADGSTLKLYGYKVLGWGLWLIGVAIGWGWPAVVVYLNDGHLSPWSMAGLAAYYALSLLGVLVGIGRKIRNLFTREPSPIRRLEKLIHEMERPYHALATGRISDRVRRAFDKSFEAGVLWNPQIFQILDAATRR